MECNLGIFLIEEENDFWSTCVTLKGNELFIKHEYFGTTRDKSFIIILDNQKQWNCKLEPIFPTIYKFVLNIDNKSIRFRADSLQQAKNAVTNINKLQNHSIPTIFNDNNNNQCGQMIDPKMTTIEYLDSKFQKIKKTILFLNDSKNEEGLDFIDIWINSTPNASEHKTPVTLCFSTSLLFDIITFTAAGVQNSFSPRLVDFLWTIGVSEDQIDILNEHGAAIIPSTIGQSIELNAKGYYTAKWIFNCELDNTKTFSIFEQNPLKERILNWLTSNSIEIINCVGRNFPSKSFDITVKLPGNNLTEQIINLQDETLEYFDIPAIPSSILVHLLDFSRDRAPYYSVLSFLITFNSVAIEKVSIFCACDTRLVKKLCKTRSDYVDIKLFENELKFNAPSLIEITFVTQNFVDSANLGLIKQGYDILLHYDL